MIYYKFQILFTQLFSVFFIFLFLVVITRTCMWPSKTESSTEEMCENTNIFKISWNKFYNVRTIKFKCSLRSWWTFPASSQWALLVITRLGTARKGVGWLSHFTLVLIGTYLEKTLILQAASGSQGSQVQKHHKHQSHVFCEVVTPWEETQKILQSIHSN